MNVKYNVYSIPPPKEKDKMRQKFLEDCGVRFIRFKNEDVEKSLKDILEKILRELKGSHNSPPAPLLISKRGGDRKPNVILKTIGKGVSLKTNQNQIITYEANCKNEKT